MTGAVSRLPDFIIGGTEKAGTTSVFDWLAAHPEVAASARKETDFFRVEYTGDHVYDQARYGTHFAHCNPGATVWMEASPGYLGEAATVAPRMRRLVPTVRLLFILRDPVERLHSSFHFHRGRLNLPGSLRFEDYVRCCLAYDRGECRPDQLCLGEWYLKVLRFGCYAEFLATYRRELPAAPVKVMFFESLRRDPRGFMTELSAFLGVDPSFWRDFDFRPSNVTFSARHRSLHRLAVRANSLAEPVMRRYPVVKRTLVRAYKAINQDREGYDAMPAATRALLTDYYRPSIRALERWLDDPVPAAWQDEPQARAVA